jgi:dienelactone hydrolase
MNRRNFVAGGAAVTGIAAGIPADAVLPLSDGSAAGRLDATIYQTAERWLRHNRAKLVRGDKVKPQWLDGGGRFWYRQDGPEGHRFFLVDPAAKTRQPAFDHDRLARALAEASGTSVSAAALPFRAIELEDGSIELDAVGAHWRCSLESYACVKVADHRPINPLAVRSPDEKWAVTRRGSDLWLESLETGKETALTTDGEPDRGYGIPPDGLNFVSLMRRLGLPHLPPAVSWSPDSRRLITHRTDQRGVPLSYLVESTPPGGGRPALHTRHYPTPGDEVLPKAELLLFEIPSGKVVAAKTEPLVIPLFSPIMWKRLFWAKDGSAIYYYDQPRDLKTLWLKRIDPISGEVSTVVEERGEPRVEPSQRMGETIVWLVGNGREVLWYSQRDGWGHLYRYDGRSGRLRNQVTAGEWAVQQILHVDEDRGIVYFIASGLVPASPYRRQVCRVGLDGSGFGRLGDDELDHVVSVPENGAYFVDSASTPDTPPVTTARGWDGQVLVELERADISRLVGTGWTPPEQFSVKAADGTTDIHGILYRPPGFDPTKRYPVVDHPYPGPQVNRVWPSFDPGYMGSEAESVAALGFVVVAVDGRGTPGRSKAFHDLSYGHLDKAGFLEDHVAALEQLAQSRPWMDLDRVGIFGASGGGFATVRALCAFPEFYRVGVAECGNHDQRFYQLSWGETYDGPLEASRYAGSANPEIADRLQGKLLLIHGEMDDNVHPHLTLRLVDRLIAANKDFDLLIVPGAEHLSIGVDWYTRRRRWDFLVRHLLDLEPPAGYRLADTPFDADLLRDFFG